MHLVLARLKIYTNLIKEKATQVVFRWASFTGR
jgi:hypothetical protein